MKTKEPEGMVQDLNEMTKAYDSLLETKNDYISVLEEKVRRLETELAYYIREEEER